MNMIATKPLRHSGRRESMGAPQRVARVLADAARLRSDRREGRAPAPLPRTPERAAEVLRGAD